MKATFVVASAFLFAASAGLAADAKPADKPAEQPVGNDRVCFSEPSTGSHIRRRTCMTRAEYEKRRQADQEAMDNLRRGPGSGTQRDSGAGGIK